MWLRHWDLRRDPFRPGSGPFVPLPGHEEAVARIVHLARSGEPRIGLRGPAGIGKSAVLDEAIRRLRRPSRRVVLVRGPADGATLMLGLAAALRHSNRPEPMPTPFGPILDAARLLRAQGLSAVIAVDGVELLDAPEDRRILDRIAAVGRQSGASWSLIVSSGSRASPIAGSGLTIRLDRLSKGEAEAYLVERLRAAGRAEPTFTDRAVLRLHAIAEGVPGAIDLLAGLALRAGALEGREMVPTSVVEGVAAEVAPEDSAIGSW